MKTRMRFCPVPFVILALILVQSCCAVADGAIAVLNAANSIPNGGGYDLKAGNHGLPADVPFGGKVLFPKSTNGSYCSGFTFAVVMKAAAAGDLFAGKSKEQIKAFRVTWYGASTNWEKQCVAALLQLGIGREVANWKDARPGDFMQLYYSDDKTGNDANKGHSVVFLGWVKNQDTEIVGIRFRSSQCGTKGVGDATAYLHDAVVAKPDNTFKPRISRSRLYVGRLN